VAFHHKKPPQKPHGLQVNSRRPKRRTPKSSPNFEGDHVVMEILRRWYDIIQGYGGSGKPWCHSFSPLPFFFLFSFLTIRCAARFRIQKEKEKERKRKNGRRMEAVAELPSATGWGQEGPVPRSPGLHHDVISPPWQATKHTREEYSAFGYHTNAGGLQWILNNSCGRSFSWLSTTITPSPSSSNSTCQWTWS